MSALRLSRTSLSRRAFLRYSALGGGAMILAACSAPEPAAAPTEAPPDPTATPEPEPTEAPVAEAPASADDEVEVMVSDVMEYVLDSEDWEAGYGSVTFMMHEAIHDGESVYYIRTDSSDPTFAEQEGLVYVPLLNAAAGMDNPNQMYVFADGRPSVIQYIPGADNYSSLFKVKNVTIEDDSLDLTSADEIEAAAEEGGVTLEEPGLFVNYPLIQWPGGGLTVDPDLVEVLPGGQLFEPADVDNMTVTMKLHQCYPGSRYILTDTGAAPMAPMMNIPAAAPTQQLKELGGTDEIWVFGNGIPGPGVMGFQPAIFDNKAGEPAWSPFWDHFTLTWVDPESATLLKESAELKALVESGELEQWNGVPDSHPNGFVVNCPAPILAPNDFEA